MMKLNEQIAFLRKQKGMTQENLANILGVTNQTVSKWEAAQCCPDIQLLPVIAELFEVSIDELMGYRPTAGLGDICLKTRDYFRKLPEGEAFENVYRLAALLHEAAMTDGYKRKIPWQENKDYSTEEVKSWGLSICSEPEGSTGRKNNSIFFSIGKGYVPPKISDLRQLAAFFEKYQELNVLKTLFAIYHLTLENFEEYRSGEEIAKKAHLTTAETEEALQKLPVEMKEEEGVLFYRLDGACYHLPAVLSFLYGM